jgi:redox-sensitive bicupin YhaK (pirin superfamily)
MISGKGVVHSERGKPDDINGHLQTDDDKLQQIPKRSHGLQLWLALPKDDEDVDPSFHSSNAVPIPLMTDNDDSSQNPSSSRRSNLQSSADLVIGEFNGIRSNIPLHPKMGKVFFLDVNLLQKGEIFNFCSRPVSCHRKCLALRKRLLK